mmetsp:Transcript_11294/g.26533  ORF Transcript_11294/g.26533 Transcript_11294/m.26533 type:complete len:237 (+) Transcript_11294:1230-1940(+)
MHFFRGFWSTLLDGSHEVAYEKSTPLLRNHATNMRAIANSTEATSFQPVAVPLCTRTPELVLSMPKTRPKKTTTSTCGKERYFGVLKPSRRKALRITRWPAVVPRKTRRSQKRCPLRMSDAPVSSLKNDPFVESRRPDLIPHRSLNAPGGAISKLKNARLPAKSLYSSVVDDNLEVTAIPWARNSKDRGSPLGFAAALPPPPPAPPVVPAPAPEATLADTLEPTLAATVTPSAAAT